MTAHAAIAAVPKTGTPNRTLLQALLVSRYAWIVGSGESPADFDPRGEDGSPVTLVIGYNGLWFWLDEADSTTGHDGTTCIVTTATAGRYKVTGVELLITSVISKTLTTPPDPDDVDEGARPSNGDSYIVPSASTGDWATWTGSIAVWVEARREWFRILPKAGWFVSVPGATRDVVYRYDSVQADWITGDGATAGADTIPLSAIQGCSASLTVRVVNQTTYAPPGSRKTGATPTMPLGGTASNINDNDDATTGVTSALGDLSGATVAGRIIGRLALAAATDLITIEARGVLGSAVSSSNAMGLYYSTDNGANWTQAGSGFTLSATAQNIQRNGSFAGVTDIALVTEAKNWSTSTNTLAGLNAYDATVTGSVGDSYIIASPAIGVFAGHEGKVARCEVADTYTIYTPLGGDVVHDINLGYKVEWNEAAGAWQSAAGSIFKFKKQRTASTGSATAVTASPSSGYTFSDTAAPTTIYDRLEDAGAGTFSHRALSATNELVIDYQVKLVAPDAGLIAFGLLVDSLTDAVDWVGVWNNAAGNAQMHNLRLTYAPGDTTLHTYKIAVFRMAGFSAPTSISRRLATLMEVVVDS